MSTPYRDTAPARRVQERTFCRISIAANSAANGSSTVIRRRARWVHALLFGSLAWLSACAQVPIQLPLPTPLSGTWVAREQAFVFCPGGTLVVMDPTLRVNWCQGPYSADGRFSVNCAPNSPGGVHTSTGRCTLTGNNLTCPYSWGSGSQTFSGTRGSGGVCPTSAGAQIPSLSTTPAGIITALTENFETPRTANYTVFRTGQTFTTATNTWVVESGTIDLFNAQVRREAVSFDGTQAIDLAGSPGAGVMSTTFATTPGQRYSVQFYYARNNGLGAAAGRANVAVLGASPLLQAELRHEAPRQFNQNVAFNGAFVADGAKATLRFTSLNAGVAGITVDGITIRPMSAPQ